MVVRAVQDVVCRRPGAVEHLQHMQAVYEVECELVDAGGAYLASHADDAVAASALKAKLLLGRKRRWSVWRFFHFKK